MFYFLNEGSYEIGHEFDCYTPSVVWAEEKREYHATESTFPIQHNLLTSEASSSFVYQTNLSMSGPAQPGPVHGHAFDRLISPRLWIRVPCGLHRGIGPFKLP